MKKCLTIILLIMFALISRAEKLATLTDFTKPTYLAADEQQFYVIEKAQVYIYSLKDFSLVKKFGKAGEGPQEFKIGGDPDDLILFPQPDYLFFNSLGRISFFTKGGIFIKEIKTAGQLPFFQPLGSQFVGIAMLVGENRSLSFAINLYDKNLRKLGEINRQKMVSRGRLQFPMVRPSFAVSDNKIILRGEEGFVVNILDKRGNEAFSIKREYKKLKMTDNYRNSVFHFFKTDPGTKAIFERIKNRIKFSDFFPVIQFIFAADKKIYIQTNMEKEGKCEFFIYDMSGKFLARLFLPVKYLDPINHAPMCFKNNKLYRLLESEDGEHWELHAVNILKKTPGKLF